MTLTEISALVDMARAKGLASFELIEPALDAQHPGGTFRAVLAPAAPINPVALNTLAKSAEQLAARDPRFAASG